MGRVLGRNHPDIALCLSNLANFYKDQGRYAESISLYEKALSIYVGSLGEQNPNTIRVQSEYEEVKTLQNLDSEN